jgi:CheY-like chemotaxis protein
MSRILVVDADPDTLRIALFSLKEEGYRVLAASSVADAMTSVEARGMPALVLVGPGLPSPQRRELLTWLAQTGGAAGPRTLLPPRPFTVEAMLEAVEDQLEAA